jgi:hypothetical protein
MRHGEMVEEKGKFLIHHCCALTSVNDVYLDTTKQNMGMFLHVPSSEVKGYDTCPTFDAPSHPPQSSIAGQSSGQSSPSSQSNQPPPPLPPPHHDENQQGGVLSKIESSLSNVFHHVKDHAGHEQPEDMSVEHNNEGNDASAATSVVLTANGEEAVCLITPRHMQELKRQSLIQWDKYGSFIHHGKNIPDLEV